jgi:hypothetical protein
MTRGLPNSLVLFPRQVMAGGLSKFPAREPETRACQSAEIVSVTRRGIAQTYPRQVYAARGCARSLPWSRLRISWSRLLAILRAVAVYQMDPKLKCCAVCLIWESPAARVGPFSSSLAACRARVAGG